MTKAECRNEILRNEQLIIQYNNQITTLQREIRELQTAQTKLTTLQTDLSDCKNVSVTNLAATTGLDRINKKITTRFYDGMNDMLTGSQYINVDSGLDSGIEKIAGEITKKKGEIETCRSNIAACNSRIQQMNSEIARIEAEEERERERLKQQASAGKK